MKEFDILFIEDATGSRVLCTITLPDKGNVTVDKISIASDYFVDGIYLPGHDGGKVYPKDRDVFFKALYTEYAKGSRIVSSTIREK